MRSSRLFPIFVTVSLVIFAGLVFFGFSASDDTPESAEQPITLPQMQLDQLRATLTGRPPGRTQALKRLVEQPELVPVVRPILDRLADDPTLTPDERRHLERIAEAAP